jgi:hypothetical protein
MSPFCVDRRPLGRKGRTRRNRECFQRLAADVRRGSRKVYRTSHEQFAAVANVMRARPVAQASGIPLRFVIEQPQWKEHTMASDPTRMGEMTMDPASLYREEIYTDRKVGTLRVLQPVKSDGSADASRPVVYQGEAQLMTNMGPLPISFDIDADNLADAIAGYPEATKAGVERAMREIQEMRRQASSSIVLPPAGATLGPGGTLPGGGKIQIP